MKRWTIQKKEPHRKVFRITCIRRHVDKSSQKSWGYPAAWQLRRVAHWWVFSPRCAESESYVVDMPHAQNPQNWSRTRQLLEKKNNCMMAIYILLDITVNAQITTNSQKLCYHVRDETRKNILRDNTSWLFPQAIEV